MNWHRRDPYYLASNCGRYTVAKTYGSPGTRYSAWRGRTPLNTFDNADDARLCCERDEQQTTTGKNHAEILD